VRLSEEAVLPVWHPGGDWNAGSTRVVVVLGQNWEEQAGAYFASPYSAWIEAGSLADPALVELIRRAATAEIYASFTTLTANRMDIAGGLLPAIAARRPLPEQCRDNIELALHEALANALVHGNLEMEGIGDLSVDALERFTRNFSSRLADPGFAGRRIDVTCDFGVDTVTIDVADQGCGFEPKPRGEPRASGRGYELISASCQSYRLLDGGRRVSMRFPV
jgi:anti-sigma regulatory factor (Ser/Thr protein kinase)